MVTLVVTIFGIQYYFEQAYEEQIYTEVLAPESDQLKNLHAKEDTQLYSYQYMDRTKGSVRLTIDRAMDLLAKEAAENKLPYPTKPYRGENPGATGGWTWGGTSPGRPAKWSYNTECNTCTTS